MFGVCSAVVVSWFNRGNFMDGDPERRIAGPKPGHQLCLIYDTVAEQMVVIVSFMRVGHARGECCFSAKLTQAS